MKKEPQIWRLEDNNNDRLQELKAYEAAYNCTHPKNVSFQSRPGEIGTQIYP